MTCVETWPAASEVKEVRSAVETSVVVWEEPLAKSENQVEEVEVEEKELSLNDDVDVA